MARLSPDHLEDIADEVFGELEDEYGLGNYIPAFVRNHLPNQAKAKVLVPGTRSPPKRPELPPNPQALDIAKILKPFAVQSPQVLGTKIYAALRRETWPLAVQRVAAYAVKVPRMSLVLGLSGTDMSGPVVPIAFEMVHDTV